MIEIRPIADDDFEAVALVHVRAWQAAYAGIVAVPAYFVEKKEREPTVYGVIDHAGILGLGGDIQASDSPEIPEDMRRTLEATGQGEAIRNAIASDNFVFRPVGSEEEARRALAARTLNGFYVLPRDYLASGTIESYAPATL